MGTALPDGSNLISSALVLPGLFRGALDVRARLVDDAMKLAAAERLAALVGERDLREGRIISPAMGYEVARAAMESGAARLRMHPEVVAQRCYDLIYEGLVLPVPPLDDSHA